MVDSSVEPAAKRVICGAVPADRRKRLIATGDAQMPVWSRDGRELLYIDPARPSNGGVGFSSVTIDTQRGLAVSQSVVVLREFNVTGPGIGRPRTYDVLRDGRFVGVMDESRQEARRIEVVLNWLEELKQRVPTR